MGWQGTFKLCVMLFLSDADPEIPLKVYKKYLVQRGNFSYRKQDFFYSRIYQELRIFLNDSRHPFFSYILFAFKTSKIHRMQLFCAKNIRKWKIIYENWIQFARKFFHKLNMFQILNCKSKLFSNFFHKQFPPFRVVKVSIIEIMKWC